MTDDGRRDAPSAPSDAMPSAGAILRQARQAQGLHIVALAAAMKVAPRKLEALEADRYDELLDATFVRALAKAVCRALKIDPEPVLERLPQAGAHGLDRVAANPNTPFREPAARSDLPVGEWLRKPAVWGPLLIVVAAAAVWLVPKGLLPQPIWPMRGDAASAPATDAGAAAAAGAVVESVVSTPADASASAPAAEGAAASASLLMLRTSGESWVEVVDARGHTLVSRLLAAGENVGLDGAPPLRVTVGNAAVTQLSFRGKPVTLPSAGRDNVVRVELQ